MCQASHHRNSKLVLEIFVIFFQMRMNALPEAVVVVVIFPSVAASPPVTIQRDPFNAVVMTAM